MTSDEFLMNTCLTHEAVIKVLLHNIVKVGNKMIRNTTLTKRMDLLKKVS